MSTFGDKVRAAYGARQARVVRVPEWDLDLHVWPVTIAQVTRINAETDSIRRAARIVQVRGKSATGEALISDADFEELCSFGMGPFGPQVVVRVAGEIMQDWVAQPDEQAAEGNS